MVRLLESGYQVGALPLAARIAVAWWGHHLRGASLVSRACSRLLRARACRLRVGGHELLLPYADPISLLYLADGVLNKYCVAALRRVLRSGAVVYDIGANYGLFGWQALPLVGAEGRVTFFEPNPAVAARLRDNLAANCIANATVVEQALSDRVGTACLLVPARGQSGLATLQTVPCAEDRVRAQVGWQRQTVKTVTVDEFAQQSGQQPALLKLDVEGHELKVLRGAEKTLASCHPVIMLEMHEPGGEVAGEIMALLARHGYEYLYAASHTQITRTFPGGPAVPITDLIAATEDLGLLTGQAVSP